MQVLSPGVEYGHQPDLGAEVLGIGSDDAPRLGRRREQNGVDHGLVVESDLGDVPAAATDRPVWRHRCDRSMGRSAALRRSARPHTPAVIVDERDHGLCRRSSSARAKYADALRRISFAWRSSRFSRSSVLIRSRSSLVGPGR